MPRLSSHALGAHLRGDRARHSEPLLHLAAFAWAAAFFGFAISFGPLLSARVAARPSQAAA